MILIISDRADLQIYRVMIELEQLGVQYGLFNAKDFPTTARVSQRFGVAGDASTITLDDRSIIPASDVGAVWYRKPEHPLRHPAVTEEERSLVRRECEAGLRGLYDALAHAYWISPLDSIRIASNKLRQLRYATRLGFSVPRSLFTNDPVEARTFLAALRGPAVYKPIGDRALLQRDNQWDEGHVVGEIYTTLLDERTIETGLARLSACPVLLQEYIEKDVELRVTVVGDSVFAAELRSQEIPDSQIDWRRGDPIKIKHAAHDLPTRVAELCVQIVKSFDLQFGAIDLIKTPDGNYFFLEVNPNGQYGWIEELTSLEISRAIAEHLAKAEHATHA